MKRPTRLLPRSRHGRSSSNPSAKETEAIPCSHQSDAHQTHFFNVASPEVLCHVLRHLSKQPYSRNWMEWFEMNDVETMLRLGGTLRAASREMFKPLDREFFLTDSLSEKRLYALLGSLMAPDLESMAIYPQADQKINHEQLRSLRVLTVSCNFRCEDLSRILHAHGETLAELYFDVNQPFIGRVLEDHSLSWQDWEFRKFWGEFDFEVKGLNADMVRAIAVNCKSLKVFRTNFLRYAASLEPIWEASGNSLVEFRGYVPEKELKHITRHCVRLEKLELANVESLMLASSMEFFDLLRAVKTLRVLFLFLHCCPGDLEDLLVIDELRMLVAAWPPNFRIHGFVTASFLTPLSNFVREVGAHLRSLKFHYSAVGMPSDIGPALRNVECLALHPIGGYSDEMIESVFAEPLPNLQRLSLYRVRNSKVLRNIARSVRNLRELRCSFGLKTDVGKESESVLGSDFAELLRANVHLRYIAVDCEIPKEQMTKVILDFILLLKGCRCLEHVDIANDECNSHEWIYNKRVKEISNACVPLRTKSFSLFVSGVWYLPS